MGTMAKSDEICADCGSREPAILKNRGYAWMEILCWLALVLPGIIFSIWRRARRHWVCAYCGNPSMISIHSKRARWMIALMQTQELPKELFKQPMGVTELKPPKRRTQKKPAQPSTKSAPKRKPPR